MHASMPWRPAIALPDALGLSADEISAALLFTTHDHIAEPAPVDHVHDSSMRGTVRSRDDGSPMRCEGSFEAWDYRHDRAITGALPEARWTLNVSVWLLKDPVLIPH